MSCPPDGEGQLLAESVLADMYDHRQECLTFRRSGVKHEQHNGRIEIDIAAGAPEELSCAADASTTPRDVYSVLLTYMDA